MVTTQNWTQACLAFSPFYLNSFEKAAITFSYTLIFSPFLSYAKEFQFTSNLLNPQVFAQEKEGLSF